LRIEHCRAPEKSAPARFRTLAILNIGRTKYREDESLLSLRQSLALCNGGRSACSCIAWSAISPQQARWPPANKEKIWSFDPRDVENYFRRRKHAAPPNPAADPPSSTGELDVEKHPNGRIKRLTIRVGIAARLVPILILSHAFGIDLPSLLRLLSPLIGR